MERYGKKREGDFVQCRHRVIPHTGMLMEIFDLDNLDPYVTKRGREAMLDLILAWGKLDGALSMWVSAKFRMEFDAASILIGRVPGDVKLARLRQLYKLEGNAGMAGRAKEFAKQYEEHVQTRNTIAHSNCKGMLKSDRSRIVFMSFAAPARGHMAVEAVSIEAIKKSTEWAKALADRIEQILELATTKPGQ